MVGSALAQGSRDQHTAAIIMLTSNLQVPPAILGPSLEMTLKPKAQSPEPLALIPDSFRRHGQREFPGTQVGWGTRVSHPYSNPASYVASPHLTDQKRGSKGMEIKLCNLVRLFPCNLPLDPWAMAGLSERWPNQSLGDGGLLRTGGRSLPVWGSGPHGSDAKEAHRY